MGSVGPLIVLYAAIMLFNTSISFILWFKQKIDLYRSLGYIWTSGLLLFFAQGLVTGKSDLAIVYASTFSATMSLTCTLFIAKICPIKPKWKLYIALIILGLSFSTLFYYQNQSFFIIAFPTSVTCVFSMLTTAFIALKKYRKQLSFSAQGFIWGTILLGLHQLDFAILYPIETGAIFGFTLAILAYFVLSVFAFSYILEITTQEKSRVEAEVNVAQKIQTEILPQNPIIPGFELTCYMRPADEVGGDFYDIHSIDGNAWLLLGDVTGHGLGSGLVMFMAQSIISSILNTNHTITPSELNHLTNTILCENLLRLNEQRPMTLVSMKINQDKSITYSGCHDTIYLFRHETTTIEPIKLEHFPIGVGFEKSLELTDFEQETLQMNKNDILLIVTDGISEAENPISKELFGDERLLNILLANATSSTEIIRNKILEELNEYTNEKYQDDVTFIVMKAC